MAATREHAKTYLRPISTIAALMFFMFASITSLEFNPIKFLRVDEFFSTLDTDGDSYISIISVHIINIIISIILSIMLYYLYIRIFDVTTSLSATSHERHDEEPLVGKIEMPDRIAITYLNRRIQEISARSSLIYWTIIFSLLAGVLLIIFSGKLAALDSTLSTLAAKNGSELQSAMKSIDQIYVNIFSRFRFNTDPNQGDIDLANVKIPAIMIERHDRLLDMSNEIQRTILSKAIDGGEMKA